MRLLPSPLHLLFRLGTKVTKVLDVQKHLHQLVSSRRRQEALVHIDWKLIVLDRLACRLGQLLHNLLHRCHAGRSRQDLALVLVGIGQDCTHVLSRIASGLNQRGLRVGRDDPSHRVNAIADRTGSHHFLVVLHEGAWREEGAFDWQGSDVCFDLGLAVEASHLRVLAARDLLYIRKGAEDEIFDAGGDCCIGDGHALFEFGPVVVAVVFGRGQAEDGMRAFHGGFERGLVVGVGANHFDGLLLQRLGCGLGGVARQTAQLVLFGQLGVVEDVGNDRAALLARGAKDSEDFAHGGRRWTFAMAVRVITTDWGMCLTWLMNSMNDGLWLRGATVYLDACTLGGSMTRADGMLERR